jgi:3-oxoacyl-[acyl-carrier protein] reductase
MNIDFIDRVVIVTGGTRGIGKAIADMFAEDNASVIATGTDRQQLDQLNNQTKYSGIQYRHLDFTSVGSVESFLDYLKSLKKVDVLVNCAGVNRIDQIDEINDEDWDWMNTVNLRGPYLMSKAISSMMKLTGYGRIVNISSIFGVVSKTKRASYSTTKWGLIGFTKAIALDLGECNILVNAVSPGFVDTDLTRKILSEDEIKSIIQDIPVKKLAFPDDIARTVLFLSSDLNTYITGQNIIIDGGFTSA